MRGNIATFLATVVLAGCASGGSTPATGDAYGAADAEEVVKRFVEAVRVADHQAMARLFGTTDGPAERRLGRAEVEQRMFILAALMRHESHQVRPERLTEGPDELRFMVEMTGTRSGDVLVPIVVANHRDRWYVSQVVTDSFTGGRR